jgi:aldehyde dehydrogenase (NAD+)
MWQPSWSCPTEGCFYPPTLFTDVSPSATIAQVEIFGPVVVMMSFRTPAEAVELANNTRYGLAASVWTESVNLALDIAPKLAAGTVWVNCTNMFDASAGFGGYRESGFGREGGREGLREYVRPRWMGGRMDGRPEGRKSTRKARDVSDREVVARAIPSVRPSVLPSIDRTAKLYIGGKQSRPDSGYSMVVHDASGAIAGEVGRGNRKDIRNAVEAAQKAGAWTKATAHARAQVLYYIAENLAARGDEFRKRLRSLTGDRTSPREVERSIERVFSAAAWADKWDGHVHHTPFRNVTLAMPEALGVIGIVCPDAAPLLAFVSAVMPAIALGNRVVVLPSGRAPLVATDFYQVLETSDVPAGVINIVTGESAELTAVLAAHDDVDGLWHFGSAECSADVERLSAGNMKRTWVDYGVERDWFEEEQGAGREFLEHATQVKNIWVPYGE